MNQTVIGIFTTAAAAQNAAQLLQAAGFGLEQIDVAHNRAAPTGESSDNRNASGTAVEGAVDAAGRAADRTGDKLDTALQADKDPSDYRNTSGTAVEGAADAAGRSGDSISNFFSSLFGGDEDAQERTNRYAHVARQSSSIVTVHCPSAANAQQAADILDQAGAVDVDEQAAHTGYAGSNSLNASAQQPSTSAEGTMSAQVIEESLQVGKRVEQTGGTRLRSRIVERPVEASVRLREEHVTVQRTPVNRPATEADFNTFTEGEIQLTESAERAVVGKEARVVEEITLGKEVTEREEVIRDTVRKTEVDIERLESNDPTPRTDSASRNEQ